MNASIPVLLCGCLIFPAGCTKVGIDRSVVLGEPLTGMRVQDVPVHGQEILVEIEVKGGKTQAISGELLAVDAEAIWVLAPVKAADEARPRKLPRTRVRSVELVELYPSRAGGLAVWTTLGTLSTISHGVWLIASAPAWLLTGISTSVHAGATNDLEVARRDFDRLHRWARFPQGMPEERRPPPAPAPAAPPAPGAEPAPASEEPRPVKPSPGPRPEPEPAQPLPESLSGKPTRGAYLLAGRRTLWALGTCRVHDDPARSRQQAAMRARAGIARMLTEFRRSRQGDGFDPRKNAGQSREILQGAEIADRWVDPGDGTHYAIAVLPLDAAGLSPEEADRLWRQRERAGR